MQGKRNDLYYDDIIKFISNNEPVSVTDLHEHLKTKYKLYSPGSRSRLIAKLEKLNLIVRTGKKPGIHCFFNVKI